MIELLGGSVTQSTHEYGILIPDVAIALDDAMTCETWWACSLFVDNFRKFVVRSAVLECIRAFT